jgi:PAS domain S-box-containing protein
LALAYVLLANIVVRYFQTSDNLTSVWLPSGLALAALLIGGKKYWPGVFIGTFVANLVAGSSVLLSAAFALGNTLSPLLGAWLLTRAGRFDPSLRALRDYFRLILLAGFVSASVSATVGASALFWAGFKTQQTLPLTILHWWMGDAVGIILVAPLILVWRQRTVAWLKLGQVAELASLLILAFLAGQIIFLGWFHDIVGQYAKVFLIFIFITWGAVRFGPHCVTLIIGMALIQALVGVAHGVGYFAGEMAETSLVNLWLYFIALATIGISQAIAADERKLAEIALYESEERFRQLAENIPEAFLVRDITSNKMIYVSPGFETVWGMPVEHLYQNPRAFEAAIHPEDRGRIAEAFTSYRQQSNCFNEKYRIIRPDGMQRWVWTRAFPVRNERGEIYRMVGIVEDITSQKELEFSLKKSEETARLLIEHAPVGIALIDQSSHKLKRVNQALCNMLGYSAEELYALTVTDITYADDIDISLNNMKKLYEGKIPTLSFEKRYIRKDGETIWAKLLITAISDQNGKRSQGMAIIEDITSQREAHALHIAAMESQRDALVREVHHRIKNNLQGVVGLMRQYANEHAEVAELVNEITDKVSSVAVVHGLQSSHPTEEINLSEMINKIGNTSSTFQGQLCLTHINSMTEIPIYLNRNEAVPTALILNELLVNACKHGHEGTALSTISIDLSQEGNTTAIRIANNRTTRYREFDFEQGNGLGTGLSLIKSLLPRHGATLRFYHADSQIIAELQLVPPVILLANEPHFAAEPQ